MSPKTPSGRSGTLTKTLVQAASSSNRPAWRSCGRNISALSAILRFDETTRSPPRSVGLDIGPVLQNQLGFDRNVAYFRQVPLRNPVGFVNSHCASPFVLQVAAHQERPAIEPR